MEKMNCDIVQDLMPSYVDGICSQASKDCVETHIKECEKCREMMKCYKQNEFSETEITMKQVDAFKKIHAKMKRQNVFSGILVFLLAGMGIYTFGTNYISMSTITFYVLFPVCLIGLYIVSSKKQRWEQSEKPEYIMAGASLVSTIFGIGILFYLIGSIQDGRIPFHLKLEQTGPFIHRIWGILFLIQIILFTLSIFRMLHKHIDCRWVITTCMTSMFLLLCYVTLLRELTSVKEFKGEFMQMTVVVGVIGIVGIGVFRKGILNRRIS